MKMGPTFEELLDDLISAARSTPPGGDPDTIDIEDAKKACMAFFQRTPVVVSTDFDSTDGDIFFVVVSCASDMSIRTELRTEVNCNGGMCECCSGGDSLKDIEKDEDRLLLELAVDVDAHHPSIVAFKERVRAHREEVHARMAARAQEVREAVQERSKPVLDALIARKRDRKT